MKNKITVATPYKFFSAANSREGFINYFENTFSRDLYRKIYILKGGPGTGKSTLMKKLCKFSEDKGVYNEAIYCSSDVNSLDGVIISNGKEKVAVFDGTAPHTSDTVLPGAVDVILNLGAALDEKKLESRKKDIVTINKESASAYAKAYEHLSKIQNIGIKNAAESDAYEEAERIMNTFSKVSAGRGSVRLVSAFANCGLCRIGTLSNICDVYRTLDGSIEYKSAVLHHLKKLLDECGLEYIEFPFALDTGILEAIYIPSAKTAVSALRDGAEMSTTDLLLEYGFSNLYIDSNEKALEGAKSAFERASVLHFELEDIYTAAIDFDCLDRIYAEISSKIGNMLQI